MRLSAALSLLLAVLLPTMLHAAPEMGGKGGPVYMTATQMGYDKTNAIVVAQGKVQVVQGDYVLFADRIAYYQNQNVVRAQGNISLLEPDGNVVFADDMKLKDDLKQGVIGSFRVRLSDNSLFAAREARKTSDTTYELSKAVYSPCKLCRNEETGEAKAPLWQIKANEVEIDEEDQSVVYHHAWMEVYGIPVAYTPYFSHPTPNADRKTGILTPQYSQNSQLGTTFQLPVYINIAPDKDATITPYLTSDEGPVLIGQYRQVTDKGYYQFDGSITNPDKRDASGVRMPGESEVRGHIFAAGGSELSQHWSWGFDVNRATDDTYLRRYRFGNQDTLRSRLFAEMIKDRDYAQLEGIAFQGMEAEDDPDRTPFVLPVGKVHMESRPLAMGSRIRMEASGRSLTREIGSDSHRATLETGVHVPLISRTGHVFEADASVRGDMYSVSNLTLPNDPEYDGSEARGIPQAAVGWRYPMMKFIGDDSLTLEPMVQVVATSNGNNPETIANEDSLVPEFSDINLFSYDRFAGYDRVDNGTRVVYGGRGEYRTKEGTAISAMLGQDVQLYGDRSFPASNDPDDFSDYVGKFGLQSLHWDLDYRFRLDSDDFGLRRSEARAGFLWDPVNIYADHLLIDEDPVLTDREEALLSTGIRLTDEWSINGYGRRDLLGNEMRSAGGGVTWQNDCVTVVTRVDREFTRDRDFEPDTSFSVRLFLKNLN